MFADGCGDTRWLAPALAGDLKPEPESDCMREIDIGIVDPAAQGFRLFVNGRPLMARPPGNMFATRFGVELRQGTNSIGAFEPDRLLAYPYTFPVNGPGAALAGMLDDDEAVELVQARGGSWTLLRRNPLNRERPPPQARTMRVRRDESGKVLVDARACVGNEDPILDWAVNSQISAPEWLLVHFGVHIQGEELPASSPEWARIPTPTVRAELAADGCTPVEARFEIASAQLRKLTGSFPRDERERLVVSGFGDDIMLDGPRPERDSDGALLWVGSADKQPPSFAAPVPQYGRKAGVRQQKQEASDPGVRDGVYTAWANLKTLLPGVVRSTLWRASALAPVALIFWALRRYRPRGARARARHLRCLRALNALLLFMVAFALYPLLLDGARTLFDVGRPSLVYSTFLIKTVQVQTGYTSLAVLVAMLCVPLLRHGTALPRRRRRWWKRVGAGFAIALLLILGFLANTAQKSLAVPGLFESLQSEHWIGPLIHDSTPLAAVGMIVLVWLVACAALLWLPVYWLFKTATPRGRVLATAVGASSLLLLIPLITITGDVALVFAPLLSDPFPVLAASKPRLSLVSAMSARLVVIIVVLLVLKAFREITAQMLPHPAERFRRFTSARYLLALTLLIVWPVFRDLSPQAEVVHLTVGRLMSVFQAYGALLALIAVLAMMREQDWRNPRAATPVDLFTVPDTMLLLCAAAFAGYLTIWSRDPLSLIVLMAAGWFAFLRISVDAQSPSGGSALPDGTPQKLADYMEESRLLDARSRALEKKFTSGNLSLADFRKEQEVTTTAREELRATLAVEPRLAKRALLQCGPGESPLRNGARGAAAGLLAAIVVQTVLPFDLSALGQSGWAALVSKVSVAASPHLVTDSVRESQVLVLLNSTLNATAVWVIAGFIFGYLFHVLRGNDGFQKAAYFGAGIALPYVLSHALGADERLVAIESLVGVVPVLVFLMLLGVLGFDVPTLRKRNLTIGSLQSIYGLRTSVGYLSVGSGLAALKPILDLLGSFVGGAG